ncbi:hypothetical protein ACI6QG_12545 [Roseococcus sp. DSY-14]|uniref:hypothetical protein n=1 Tax=Roseococcus sp. DSY-14 TaxID=3369650 RepID=UPI00387A9D21
MARGTKAWAALGLLALGGCGSVPGAAGLAAAFQPDPGRTMSAAPLPLPAATAAPAGDAVAQFAAAAAPGQSGMAGAEVARLGRAYHAASGRECREVILGTGFNERAQVACRQPDGSFASARALLAGGGR